MKMADQLQPNGGGSLGPKDPTATKSASMLYRYLLGAMQQIQITMTVRALCIPDEVNRLPAIVEAWRRASRRMQELSRIDGGVADRIGVEDVPNEIRSTLAAIETDPLFQASFSTVPSTFKIVEIDSLVAPQREVNLDYVAALRKRIRGKQPSDLVEFCLAPRSDPPPVRDLQTAANQMTFTSPSLDLRFLGGFPKPIGEDDVRVAHLGGQPVQVVTLLVGFGAAPINVWSAGNRLVLNNGFHRIIALRSEGIPRIPVVVQQAANPEVEFPDQILGLPRSYLLQHPRPVLVKDFFDDSLILELRLKSRMKSVKLSWGPEEGVFPVE